MTEQTPAESDEPEAAADDALDVSGDADADASSDADTELSFDDDDDDDEPGRDPDAQAEVDEATGHSTTLRDSASVGPGESPFRTPPGIPGGLDPKTLADRDK